MKWLLEDIDKHIDRDIPYSKKPKGPLFTIDTVVTINFGINCNKTGMVKRYSMSPSEEFTTNYMIEVDGIFHWYRESELTYG